MRNVYNKIGTIYININNLTLSFFFTIIDYIKAM